MDSGSLFEAVAGFVEITFDCHLVDSCIIDDPAPSPIFRLFGSSNCINYDMKASYIKYNMMLLSFFDGVEISCKNRIAKCENF